MEQPTSKYSIKKRRKMAYKVGLEHGSRQSLKDISKSASKFILMALFTGVVLGIGWGAVITAEFAPGNAPLIKMICSRA